MNCANYFDHAATTPVDSRVLDAMLPWLGSNCGNAHSIHSWGSAAREAVELARTHIAQVLGADDPSEITFTSGATESNNWVLSNFKTFAISPFEHNSVRDPARKRGAIILGNVGFELKSPEVPVELISVMSVNNETGALLSPPFANEAKLHQDLTQQVGKLPIDLDFVDYGSLSSHKFYGPKGVGALYIKGATGLDPLIAGGGQENALRSGTLNVPGIVGMGEAARIANDQREFDFHHAEQLRAVIVESLSKLPDVQFNVHTSNSPFVLSVSFLGIVGESLVIELDQLGFAISSGPACSSKSIESSHVLKALGLDYRWLSGTIRISVGRKNTVDSASELCRHISGAVKNLRQLRV